MSKLFDKAKNFGMDIKKYWHTPREGDYVSYKEYGSYCLGHSGGMCAGTIMTYFSFSASCLLVGAIYGISFRDIYVLGLIGTPLGLLMAPIGMMLTDNLGVLEQKTMRKMNMLLIPMFIIGLFLYFVPQQPFEKILPALPQTMATMLCTTSAGFYYKVFVYKKLSPKYGKYRPWIIAGGVPSFIIIVLLAYLPFGAMTYFSRFWILHLLFSIYGNFSSFAGQSLNLINVISPNTEERTRLMSFGTIISSIIPSIFNVVLPVLATMTGGYENLRTYRTVMPALLLVFIPMVYLLAFKVEDKVVIPKSHKPKISFKQGAKSVLSNKYHWINTISGLLGSVNAGSVSFVTFMFVYALRKEWLLGVYMTIIGLAYNPGFILAPSLIRRFDKRNLKIIASGVGLISLLGQYYALRVNSIVLFTGITFISILLTTPASVASQAMGADQWDYQQYKYGERLDGFAGIFGLFTTPLTMLTGMIVPAIFAAIGFTSDWDILFDPIMRNKVILIAVVLNGISGVLSIIPYFFYDLSTEKHKFIIEELKKRAEAEEQAENLLATGEGGE